MRVDNALVTGKGSNGFFVQVKEGDAGYMGADYSGLFVFTGAMAPTLANAVVGARVTIDGTVANFQGQIELDSVDRGDRDRRSAPRRRRRRSPSPTPRSRPAARARPALESVLVSLGAATVTAVNATFGEFTLTVAAPTR